jgi:hypothetical protein
VYLLFRFIILTDILDYLISQHDDEPPQQDGVARVMLPLAVSAQQGNYGVQLQPDFQSQEGGGLQSPVSCI